MHHQMKDFHIHLNHLLIDDDNDKTKIVSLLIVIVNDVNIYKNDLVLLQNH